MNIQYKSEYNLIEVKRELTDLIENQREDKFFNHFRNIITIKTNIISGKISNNDFVIWHYDHIWSGMFYSVIVGKIIDNGETCFLEMYPKLNKLALFLEIVISFIIGYVILTGIIIQNDNLFKFLILRFLIGVVLFLLFQTVPIITYYNSKKRMTKLLKEKLKLI